MEPRTRFLSSHFEGQPDLTRPPALSREPVVNTNKSPIEGLIGGAAAAARIGGVASFGRLGFVIGVRDHGGRAAELKAQYAGALAFLAVLGGCHACRS